MAPPDDLFQQPAPREWIGWVCNTQGCQYVHPRDTMQAPMCPAHGTVLMLATLVMKPPPPITVGAIPGAKPLTQQSSPERARPRGMTDPATNAQAGLEKARRGRR